MPSLRLPCLAPAGKVKQGHSRAGARRGGRCCRGVGRGGAARGAVPGLFLPRPAQRERLAGEEGTDGRSGGNGGDGREGGRCRGGGGAALRARPGSGSPGTRAEMLPVPVPAPLPRGEPGTPVSAEGCARRAESCSPRSPGSPRAGSLGWEPRESPGHEALRREWGWALSRLERVLPRRGSRLVPTGF